MEMCKITNPTCNHIKIVTDIIIKVYEKASIPTLAYATVYNKVLNLETMKKLRLKQLVFHKKRGTALTQGKFRKKSKNGKVKVLLQDVLNNLFPVADEQNIPEIEREFYEEQKTSHLMVIGGVDLVETENILEEMAAAEQQEKEAAEIEERRVARQQVEEQKRMKERERKDIENGVVNSSEVEEHDDQVVNISEVEEHDDGVVNISDVVEHHDEGQPKQKRKKWEKIE